MTLNFFTVLVLVSSSSAIDPITIGAGLGAAALGYGVNIKWDTLKCPFTECCGSPWIKHNVTQLEELIDKNVFGQHLVRNIVTRALRSHLRRQFPRKALVLSFHGWTGAGKNYVAKFIAESLYKEGLMSQYVNLYLSTLHFPNEAEVDIYKLELQEWIRGNVTACPQSMFIFDEMDKMPEGLIDGIKPFIDYHEQVMGVDYRRAIFIFLSNTGGRQITNKALEFWQDGRQREELQYNDLEDLINLGAFNEKGGLHHSSVIEKSLIDHYVPFLPMERKHVKKCIESEAFLHNMTLTEPQIGEIADDMQYWPPGDEGVYSTTGCKRVAQKVDILHEIQLELESSDL